MVTSYYFVWIMTNPPTWNAANWVITTRLVHPKGNRALGSNGRMVLKLLRSIRYDSATEPIVDSWVPIRGQFVCITTAAGNPASGNGALWYGYIDGIDYEALKGTVDYIGSVFCSELGSMLNQVPLAQARMKDPANVSDSGVILNTLPTINDEGRVSGEIIGNAVDAGATAQPAGNPWTRRLFANTPDQCGTAATNYWTRWSAADHFLTYIYSPVLPSLVLFASTPAIQTYLQSTATKEIFKPDGLTLKGLLDLLLSPVRGMSWMPVPVNNVWYIYVFSILDAAVGAIPAAPLVDGSVSGLEQSIHFANLGWDIYDSVEVVGNQIICTGTISEIDGSQAIGWTAQMETDYQKGAIGSTGYTSETSSTLSPAKRAALNRMVRGSGSLADVYVRYVTKYNGVSGFQCKNIAGAPNGTLQALCPLINWDGTTATIDASKHADPFPPTARLLRQLPWPVGVKGDMTDNRNAEMKARPNYMQPVVLSYRSSPPLGQQAWLDLQHPLNPTWHTPEVAIDSRGPALRIKYSYPEMMAFGHWTTGAANVGFSEWAPDYASVSGISIDYNTLVCTVAMESDQRIKVVKYKARFDASSYRCPLRIRRSDLHCWLIRGHTILSLNTGTNTGVTLDEVATDTFQRNDWATAQKLCDEVAAFAFRPRTSATIVLVNPYSPPAWTTLGTVVGNLSDNGLVYTLHTFVSNVEFDFDPDHPRLIVTTSDPPIPDSTAVVPLVPAIGGQVSAAMGTTLPAMVQRLDSEVKDLHKGQEKLPITTGSGPIGAMPIYGIVRWNCPDTGNDASEAELCYSDGTRASSPVLVYIDMASSCQIQDLNCFYLLEPTNVAPADQGSGVRDIYRAVRRCGAWGTTPDIITIANAGDGFGKLGTSTSTAVQTVINGVLGNNVVPYNNPVIPKASVPAGAVFDLARPFAMRVEPSTSRPHVVLDWSRSLRNNAVTTGTTPVIDLGETIIFEFWCLKNQTLAVGQLRLVATSGTTSTCTVLGISYSDKITTTSQNFNLTAGGSAAALTTATLPAAMGGRLNGSIAVPITNTATTVATINDATGTKICDVQLTATIVSGRLNVTISTANGSPTSFDWIATGGRPTGWPAA